MIIKTLQTFEIPYIPAFQSGLVYEVTDELGETLIQRGLATHEAAEIKKKKNSKS